MARTRGLGARHEERRGQIAEALLRLVDRGGLEAVNLRDVAREAEVSTGAVQHYFRSKEQMLVFALEYISEKGGERVRERLAGEQDPHLVVREVLADMVPATERLRTELRIGAAFVARSLVDDGVTTRMRAGLASLHELLVLLLVNAGITGEPEREADVLLALADGLGTHVLLGHRTVDEALVVLDERLGQLFADQPRRVVANSPLDA